MRHDNYQEQALRKTQKPGYRFSTRTYDKFQVIFVCRGSLVFETPSTRSDVGPDDVLALREGSAFSLACRREGYAGVACTATGRLPSPFQGDAATFAASENITTIARMMDKLLEQAPAHSSRELSGLARTLAWKTVRLAETIDAFSGKVRSGTELAEAALGLLKSHIYTSSPVREILSPLPISYRQLCRHFNQRYGVSPKQFQLQSKINEAKRMLAETDMNVTTIAMELGFASSQHFSTQFKNHVNRTPTRWRDTASKPGITGDRGKEEQ